MIRSALRVLLIAGVVSILLGPRLGMADTITLQQGTDGYSGCIDSFIATGGYLANRNQNFGSCSELRLHCGHYATW